MPHGEGSAAHDDDVPADLSGLTSVSRTGLDRAFRLVSAAVTGEEVLTATLMQIVDATTDDDVARSALLGGLAHICLVSVGSLSEVTGDSVERVLSALREAVEETNE